MLSGFEKWLLKDAQEIYKSKTELHVVCYRQRDSAFSAFFMSDFSDYFQVACFPFDDHNCPPIQLIASFCRSAYSWLKEDILNVVVVHCKAGMARTGLMICSLLLFLKVSFCCQSIKLEGFLDECTSLLQLCKFVS